MKTTTTMAALLAATALASSAWAADGKPIYKDCGPNNDYVIGFSQANFKEPYREHVNHELERLIKQYPKFKITIADGQASVNTQVSQVENFLTKQVDLLMISPFESAPLTPIVTRAYKGGTPVIELDRKTVGDDYTAFVGGDNREIAKQAGQWAAKTLMPDGGEAAILEGLPSSSPAIERLDGFKEGIATNPKIKLVAVLPGPSGGIRSVSDGQWAATFTYPTGAAQALELAKRILIDCATEVPRNVLVPTQRIDQSNAKEFYGKEQF